MPYRERLAEHIEKDFLGRSGVQRLKRGGSVSYAVGEEVFAFLSDDGVVLKLDHAQREALLHAPNARAYETDKPGKRDELVELVLRSFMDVMTGMEWVRHAYVSAAKRANPPKKRRRGFFSR